LGYNPEIIQGHHFFDLTSGPDSDQDSLDMFQRCLETGQVLQRATLLYHASGKPCWFNIQITPITQNARHQQSIVVLHPLDELMEKQASLQRLVDLSSDQNKRLQNFAYIVSHNIRSHAANISSLVELLDTTSAPEDQEQFKSMLKKSSLQLDETIMHLNDVISLNNELSTSYVSIDVLKTVNRVLGPLRQKMKHNQAQLDLNIPENSRVFAVPAYFESILFNLISNAIKYHKPGDPPQIEVSWESKTDHQLLKVRDRGLGIDLDRYGDRLFNMYQTFHRVKDAKGIGLFLTRNQVEAMGGEIGVKSKPNEGATFWVKFLNTPNIR
jgi:diguanylate cyclase